MCYVVPGRFNGQRRIQLRLPREIRHFPDGPPEASRREPVWLPHLEVVRRKLFGNISSENVGPAFTPDSLRKPVIIAAQFFFNVSRQHGTESAITDVGTIVLTKVPSELHFTFLRLKPGHFLSDRA